MGAEHVKPTETNHSIEYDPTTHVRLSNDAIVPWKELPAYLESLPDDDPEKMSILRKVGIGSALGMLGLGIAIGGHRAYKHLNKEGDA